MENRDPRSSILILDRRWKTICAFYATVKSIFQLFNAGLEITSNCRKKGTRGSSYPRYVKNSLLKYKVLQ
jgi:hypothetical protein